tara:strand:- start:1875 stop:2390 length:516 start_codon:yes stop_codon:yes gene_type:complete
MGCFSYMCLECGEPILSNSFSGQEVKLWFLKNGVVQESMQGQYSSYGTVFKEGVRTCQDWSMDWVESVQDHFSPDSSEGYAAVHTKCLVEGYVPEFCSDDDPNQGWGSEEDDYFSSIESPSSYGSYYNVADVDEYIEQLEKFLGRMDPDWDDNTTDEEIKLWQECHSKHYH